MVLMQVWKERVYPHLEQHLAQRVDSVTAYLLLYHEVHPTPCACSQTPCAHASAKSPFRLSGPLIQTELPA